jgi:murein DD-endopeptidase MepM/ murein hydrolase activator NlpD
MADDSPDGRAEPRNHTQTILVVALSVALAALVGSLGYLFTQVSTVASTVNIIQKDVEQISARMATSRQVRVLLSRIKYLHPARTEREQREEKLIDEIFQHVSLAAPEQFNPLLGGEKAKSFHPSKNSPGMDAVQTERRVATQIQVGAPGKVIYAGPDPNQKGYDLVRIETQSGLVLLTGHLAAAKVREGEKVSAAQTIGRTEPSSDVCVTFGVQVPGLAGSIPLSSVPPDLLR